MTISTSIIYKRSSCTFAILLLCFGLLHATSFPKTVIGDSARHNTTPAVYLATGAMLLGGGLAGHISDHNYSKLQESYFPHHSSKADNVIRWLPTAARIGLRLAGVQGRSDWNRLLASHVAIYGLNIGITEALKRSIKQTRPDGFDNRSTPSGHAALAFMSAAILDEEYGYLSPLVPLGGYAVSTMVSFNRTMGHHHYSGDVLLGAGIGLLSAKVAYALCDRILKHHKPATNSSRPAYSAHPSHIGFYGGYRMALSHFHTSDGFSVDLHPGIEAGLQGAWFPFRHIGVSGRISEFHSVLRKGSQPVNAWIDCLSTRGGICFSAPLSTSANISAQVLAGYAVQTGGRNELRSLNTPALEGVVWETGISGNFLFRKNLDCCFRIDYQSIHGSQALHSIAPSIGLNYAF